MTTKQRKILITSTGRTATKFLANYFSNNQDKICAHHITPHSPLFNVLSNLHLSFSIPPLLLKLFWQALKANDFELCKKNIFLDSNNLLYAIPLLLEQEQLYSGVVHIVRDPRDYVRSHYNWAKNRKKSWVADRLIPFWQPNGWLLGDISLFRWVCMNRFQRFCWFWSYKNHLISRIKNQQHTDYLLIRFEDLFDSNDKRKHFELLTNFVGIENNNDIDIVTNQSINVTKIKTFEHWQNWHPESCAQLNQICGKDMLKYGYGLEEDWLTKVAEGNKLLSSH